MVPVYVVGRCCPRADSFASLIAIKARICSRVSVSFLTAFCKISLSDLEVIASITFCNCSSCGAASRTLLSERLTKSGSVISQVSVPSTIDLVMYDLLVISFGTLTPTSLLFLPLPS